LATKAQNLPTYKWIQTGRTRNGVAQPPQTNDVTSIFYSATRDTVSGKIIVKIVNRADAPQDLKVEISGVETIAPEGQAIVLKADNRDATNSLKEPEKVIPVMETVAGLGTSFTRNYPPCSITILELKTK
ncbi:MAG TPA: alpha-L-arabinofuranosidase C-terminal domain-containing protein, partial [bacterium]|nr:alpha-L-arabinofuranosidase C-terminal domain-containing protein [bacterium]